MGQRHRRNPRQTEGLVDLLFGLARDDAASLDFRERVFVKRPSARQRPLTELDIVALRAGEI